ncbi:MAG: hypothetical protein WCX83_03790 [Candidatus Cloacimonas sp.]|nr:hypothetical protein [Candidatus Cloacimonadota bacterium]
MQKVFTIALLLTAVSLLCATENQTIPERVIEQFYRELPSDLPIVVQLEVDEYEMPLSSLLKGRLLNDGHRLYTEQDGEHYTITLRNERIYTRHKGGFIFIPRNYLTTSHLFTYEVIHQPTGETIDINNLTVETKIRVKNTDMRWYDPILVSTIIGGLAYLFYFGNK